MTTNPTPDIDATIAELEEMRRILLTGPSGTVDEEPWLINYQHYGAALVKASPELLSAARLAQELTALFGEDPVGRARMLLQELEEWPEAAFKQNLTDGMEIVELRVDIDSLRAALAEKKAELAEWSLAFDDTGLAEFTPGIAAIAIKEWLGALKSEQDENARLRERVTELESAATYWEKRWHEDTGITPQDER